MKRGLLLLFFVLRVHAQQHDERIIGKLVNARDRQTWRDLKNPSDVKENEIIAVYHRVSQEWLYAEVKLVPESTFIGLASCVQGGLFYNNFVVDFKKNAKKLLAENEVNPS